MAPHVGSGQHQVTALIGEGGMGQVNQVTDTTIDYRVALTVPSLVVAQVGFFARARAPYRRTSWRSAPRSLGT